MHVIFKYIYKYVQKGLHFRKNLTSVIYIELTNKFTPGQ